MAQPREYNYALYASFDDKTTATISAYVKAIEHYCSDKLLAKQTESPHLTILYGPSIYGDTKEITDKKEIESVLPGFVELFDGTLPHITCTGVSCFDRGDRMIIKLGFESKTLTQFQTFLRKSMPDVQNKYEMYAKTVQDGSYDLPPKQWLHATLAIVSPANKDTVLAYAEKICASFPKKVKVAGIQLISAKTDTVVPLW